MAEKKKSYSELSSEVAALRRTVRGLRTMERRCLQERILLRTLINNLPDAIYAKDVSCRKTIANAADVHNMGLKSESDVLGKNDFELFPKEIAEKFYADDQAVIQSGTPVLNREEYFIDADGNKRWLMTSKLPLKDQHGSVVGLIGIGRDITERKNAEQALEREKGFMDALMDNVPDSIYFKDRQCRLLKISRKMQNDLKANGITEVIGKTDVDLFGEQFGHQTLENDEQLMSLGKPIVALTESRLLEDGGLYWTSTTKVPLKDENGHITGLVGITREINELMRAQSELAYQKHYLESLVESSPTAIVTLDKDQRIQTCNKAFEAIFGYSVNEAVGQNLDELIVPEERKAEAEELTAASFRQGSIHRELERQRRNGTHIDVEVHAKTIFMDDKPAGVVAQYDDITERKQAEKEISMLASALRSINECVSITDLEDNILFVNRSFVDTYGWSETELIGKNISIVRSASSQTGSAGSVLEKTLKSEWRGELVNRRKDGSEFPISLSTTSLRDENGQLVALIGVATNITERKRIEEQLREQFSIIAEQNVELEKARDQAMEANKTKSAFLASMSHELRTPLNAIIGYSEMICEEMSDDGETRYRGDLDRIHMAGKNLLELINEVLDLSKIEAGKMELYVEEFQLSGLIDEVVSTVQPLTEKNENSLVVNIAKDILTVRLDHTKVRQILFNLISNASKFTQKGIITLTAAAIPAADPAGGKITLKVSDTGIGLTEEQKLKLFKEFSQADSSTTRKYGGTGLGLAITKHFTEMMHGSIEIESAPNCGTTFTVTLPRCIEHTGEKSPPASVPAGKQPAPIPTNTAVLVIDDDSGVRDLLSRYLSKEGYLVECVGCGEDGIKRAREILPMAIILDVMMPRKDGWAVLQEIKCDPELKSIPVIMYSMLDEKNFGLAIGASEYLIKPVSKEKILEVLEKYKQTAPSEYILVVDDNPDLRAMASRAIQKAGWEVRTAENGRSAVAHLEHALPSIIFLDIMMPVMDGFEFLTIFQNRAEWRDIPVVVITSKDLIAEERRQLNGVVKKVIQKGDFTPEKLLKQISFLIPQLIVQHIPLTGTSNG